MINKTSNNTAIYSHDGGLKWKAEWENIIPGVRWMESKIWQQ